MRGQGDAASAAGRPLRGCPRRGRAGFTGCGWRNALWRTKTMTAPTLAQLLPAARSGDAVAMEQLLRLTRPDIRRYALRHCAATTATDDVVQEELRGEGVAGRLGTTREAAKSRLHRARALVREYLVPSAPAAR